MSKKQIQHRLAMFNSLRVYGIPAEVYDTPSGPVSVSVVNRLNAMKAQNDEGGLLAVLSELHATMEYLEDLMPEQKWTGQITIKDLIKDPLKEAGDGQAPQPFGHMTAWVKEFLDSGDMEPLRNLSEAQIKEQSTVVACIIKSVTLGGKLSWTFKSNPSKMGFAFVPPEYIKYFHEGDGWILKHNGLTGIDSQIIGGIPCLEHDVQDIAQTLSKVWRRYN